MSGASMWLDACAGAGHIRSPAAAVRGSIPSTFFIAVTSRSGWCTDSRPEHPELRGEQRELECARLARPALGLLRAAVGRGDGGSVEKQPAVLRAFGEGPSDQR